MKRFAANRSISTNLRQLLVVTEFLASLTARAEEQFSLRLDRITEKTISKFEARFDAVSKQKSIRFTLCTAHVIYNDSCTFLSNRFATNGSSVD